MQTSASAREGGKMKQKTLGVIIIILSGLLLVAGGLVIGGIGESHLMRNYDLYNCIYRNADNNGFSNNPYLVEKIQNECICFREHNYTDLFEADC